MAHTGKKNTRNWEIKRSRPKKDLSADRLGKTQLKIFNGKVKLETPFESINVNKQKQSVI